MNAIITRWSGVIKEIPYSYPHSNSTINKSTVHSIYCRMRAKTTRWFGGGWEWLDWRKKRVSKVSWQKKEQSLPSCLCRCCSAVSERKQRWSLEASSFPHYYCWRVPLHCFTACKTKGDAMAMKELFHHLEITMGHVCVYQVEVLNLCIIIFK